ncbi:hypothetical protein ACEPPN_003073 [Leptodophora sp. 'Broadleaf-Isolate-01']
MQIIDISSHTIASLKSKASNLPKLRRDKKAKQEEPGPEIHEPVHTETVQPVTESAPTLQPFDIPRPVHAKKGQTALVPASVPVPVLQPLDIPRLVHAKKTPATAAPTSTPAPVPILQPFDIPSPVHIMKGVVRRPIKRDKPAQPAAPTQTQPIQPPGQTHKLSATTMPYPLLTTHPLFPPVPTYGPPTLKTRLICLKHLFSIHSLHPRPFQQEENRRAELRKIDCIAWTKRQLQKNSHFPDIAAAADVESTAGTGAKDGYVPTEGGPNMFVVDVGYYARRVGLDCEELKVQTEDGVVLDLWHMYDPREYASLRRAQRMVRGPESIDDIQPPSRPPTVSKKVKEKGK